MPSDADILQTIKRAFAGCRRPEHFTDYITARSVPSMMRSYVHATLHAQIEDVGNPGWDPICFTSPEGFAYYFQHSHVSLLPSQTTRTAGTALSCFCICSPTDARIIGLLACTPEQRLAIVQFLRHLAETRAALADSYCSTADLFQALEIWSDESPVA